MMPCACNAATGGGEFKTITVPLSEELGAIAKFFPTFSRSRKDMAGIAESDLMIHRFVGSTNGVPLDSARLYSVAMDDGPDSGAKRRFIGDVGGERLDYTIEGSWSGDMLRLFVRFHEPRLPGLDVLTLDYDVRRRWLVATEPNLLDLPDEKFHPLTPAETMVLFASDDAESYDLKCLLTIVLSVGGICALFFLAGGPNPATIAAFILCAGPAFAAAFVGCKKKAAA